MYRFQPTIGGRRLQVVALTPELGAARPVGRTHHLLILDRSGSMYLDLNSAVDQAERVIDRIGDDDLLSVGWFSGPGQFDMIVQGAKKGQDVKLLIQKLRSTVGLTVFSEVMAKAASVVELYAGIVDQTQITFLTDGNPVTPWSIKEEETRLLDIIRHLNSAELSLTALNTIGFGRYYNRELMVKMSESTEFGVFVHSSRMDEFLDIIDTNIETASGLVSASMSVEPTGKDYEVLYLGDKTASLKSNESISMRRLDATRNTVYVIGDADSILLNDNAIVPKTISVTNMGDLPPMMYEDFLYAYAHEKYYRGERQVSLDVVVSNLRDRYLADMMMNAFTQEEVASATAALRAAMLSETGRYLNGKAPAGYLPKKDALCVIDVFSILFNGEDTCYLANHPRASSYERIGRKVTDTDNRFRATPGQVCWPVDEFTWNKDQLNLSLKYKQEGTVRLNSNAAKRVGLQEDYPSCIFRTHTFIKDGSLNIKQAAFRVDSKTVRELQALDAPLTIIDSGDGPGNLIDILIDFTNLPVINRMYVDNSNSLEDIHADVVKTVRLEAAQKVVKSLLEEVLESSVSLRKEGAYKSLTADQITVLEDHGIRKDGVYGGISNKRERAEDCDFYEVRNLSFNVKGAVNLPSSTDFAKMLAGDKRANLPGQMMLDAYNDVIVRMSAKGLSREKPTAALRDFLKAELQKIKSDLAATRQKLGALKISKVLTHDWFKGLVADDKGNFSFEHNGVTIVLRSDYTRVYVDVPEEHQDKLAA